MWPPGRSPDRQPRSHRSASRANDCKLRCACRAGCQHQPVSRLSLHRNDRLDRKACRARSATLRRPPRLDRRKRGVDLRRRSAREYVPRSGGQSSIRRRCRQLDHAAAVQLIRHGNQNRAPRQFARLLKTGTDRGSVAGLRHATEMVRLRSPIQQNSAAL